MQEPLGTALKCRHQGSSQPSSHSTATQLNQDLRQAAGEQMESRHVKLQTLGLLKTTCHEGAWHSCRNTGLTFLKASHTSSNQRQISSLISPITSQTITSPRPNVLFIPMSTYVSSWSL